MEPRRHPGAARYRIAAILALTIALLPGCATRTATEPAEGEPAAAAASTPAPPPSPAPTPDSTPEPMQPQAVYRVTVSTQGGGTQQTVIGPDGASEPQPTPDEAAESAPAPTPEVAPAPTPAPGNFLVRTWRKIFPPKTPPAPEEPSNVIKIPTPREGILSRLWHSIFPRKQTPPAALPPQWIGRIQLVNEQAGYALIDTQGSAVPPVGQILRAVGNDLETGSLKISADRNPPFFIADIESGKPQPGDRVYSPESP